MCTICIAGRFTTATTPTVRGILRESSPSRPKSRSRRHEIRVRRAAPVAHACVRAEIGGIAELVDVHFQDARDFGVGRMQRRLAGVQGGGERMKPEAADRDVDRASARRAHARPRAAARSPRTFRAAPPVRMSRPVRRRHRAARPGRACRTVSARTVSTMAASAAAPGACARCGQISSRPAACRMRAGLKPWGHCRRGTRREPLMALCARSSPCRAFQTGDRLGAFTRARKRFLRAGPRSSRPRAG